MKKILIILFVLFTLSLSAQTVAKWFTSMGDFEVKMREDLVPNTVNNFIDLTNSEFYDGFIFHRVISDFMIQDGCPYGTGYGGPGYNIDDEFHEDILFNEPGVIGMANSGSPNSAGSQYFITVVPFMSGNYTYAAFGNVVEGYDVVYNISEVATTGDTGSPANKPLVDVVIDSIRIMTPQLNGYSPEDNILNQVIGDTQVFVLFSLETDLTYSWYIDDQLQTETSSILVHIFQDAGSYTFRGEASNGEYVYPVEWQVDVASTDSPESDIAPDNFNLMQNYPNPFSYAKTRSGLTTIPFSLNVQSAVTIDIFNLKGQQLVEVFSGIGNAGINEIKWDGKDSMGNEMNSGIYLYRIKSNEGNQTKKLVIIK